MSLVHNVLQAHTAAQLDLQCAKIVPHTQRKYTARLLLAAQALQAARATQVTTKSAPIRSRVNQHLAPRGRLALPAAAPRALRASTRQ